MAQRGLPDERILVGQPASQQFDSVGGIPISDSTNMLGPVAIATGDLDGDGDTDMVTANSGSLNATIFFKR